MSATEHDASTGIYRQTSSRIPTSRGTFTLHLFTDHGGKEHMALVLGDVARKTDVLVRVHSECFTGDVLGSLRCDCGPQLDRAMEMINEEGMGIVLYLRQEGRGIGLLDKLRAYNLQDEGYDTVDANLMLGHDADERDYTVAAEMLASLDVLSVRILTNNPAKIASLKMLGIPVSGRVPIEIPPIPENIEYLRTKAVRMRHLLELDGLAGTVLEPNGHHHITTNGNGTLAYIRESVVPVAPQSRQTRPTTTISYAQSLDGSIAAPGGEQLRLSCQESMEMTHRLRASHDAILVGIGTALNDDPRLNVRLVDGPDPQPIIIDSSLRLPPSASVFRNGQIHPWIVTKKDAPADRQRSLEEAGAVVLRVSADRSGRVDLSAALDVLAQRGVRSLMVEGGSRIIGSFFRERLVDHVVLTVAPMLVGGLRVLSEISLASDANYPRLTNLRYQWHGTDLVLLGDPVWAE